VNWGARSIEFHLGSLSFGSFEKSSEKSVDSFGM